MIILSNRDVYLFGQIASDGIFANAIWLKEKAIAGTDQQLWDREKGVVHGLVAIPKNTDQVHTSIFIPYVTVTPLAATADHA